MMIEAAIPDLFRDPPVQVSRFIGTFILWARKFLTGGGIYNKETYIIYSGVRERVATLGSSLWGYNPRNRLKLA